MSVAKATAKVAEYIERGRASVEVGDAAALPFPDEHFDLATAMETIFFWPDIAKGFGEAYRVLRPGGRFVVAVEAWKENDGSLHCPKVFRNIGMTLYSPDELVGLMRASGFASAEPSRGQKGNWLAVTGTRENAAA